MAPPPSQILQRDDMFHAVTWSNCWPCRKIVSQHHPERFFSPTQLFGLYFFFLFFPAPSYVCQIMPMSLFAQTSSWLRFFLKSLGVCSLQGIIEKFCAFVKTTVSMETLGIRITIDPRDAQIKTNQTFKLWVSWKGLRDCVHNIYHHDEAREVYVDHITAS